MIAFEREDGVAMVIAMIAVLLLTAIGGALILTTSSETIIAAHFRDNLEARYAAGAMIDRVTNAIGRLGPVDDSDAMAANILAIWNSDRHAMSDQAREHALQFSWHHSMEALFGRVYPAAFARRAARQTAAEASAAAPLVRA